jgi:hypothetical protein
MLAFYPTYYYCKFSEQTLIDQNLEVELEKIMTMPFNPLLITSIKLFESVANEDFHSHNTLAEVKLF